MDPYEYGKWGFVLMLISYFATINFGIANSANILMVQNKNDLVKQKEYVASAIVSISFLILGILVVAIIYSQIEFEIFAKYEIGQLFYIICIIASLEYINRLFSNIYRVYNRLLELSIYQSSIPVLIFVSVIFFSGTTLFYALIISYLTAHILSLLFFVFRGGIPFGGKVSWKAIYTILNKGLFLFLYNASFYLILITLSFVISKYYTVIEYGLYTFSYNLGHAILMILEAFTFLIFPKLVDKLYSDDLDDVNKTLVAVRDNYVSLSHGLMYMALLFFPIVIFLFPKYEDCLAALYITSLAILLSTNSFGYNTLLIARNREKTASLISLGSLLCTVLIAVVFSSCNVPFWTVPFSMMISYYLFALFCSFASSTILKRKVSIINSMSSVMPIKMFVPFLIALLIPICGLYWLSFAPLLIFTILNRGSIGAIMQTAKSIYHNSSFIDIKK